MSNSEQSTTSNNASDNNNGAVAGTSMTPMVTAPVTSPSAVGSSLLELDGEALPKYRRDLVAKQKILRAELTALQPQSGHCRLEVSRNEIFEVS